MNAKAKAIVLFGHGARDVRWREPFDRLASLWKAQHPNVLVELAFLELMQPSLEEAIGSHITAGAMEVVVVPVFFGQGGHLRNDFPVLLSACREKFPNIQLSATPAVGEDEVVLQAIIEFSARAL
ncbi:sirohydrochlorin chelatase [Polynucleobacter corsicus]|uniref:sirohydrochlorin chelatase n=1 Tax=Polynucleobacter corsicus TaxID=2081042 RepID=UPI001BFD97F5|nr:CbiX/SirB N-terminal domain-containing protein [Polynucleobacter corsicus]QWE18983.1 CbiX/SirB N-terminal domain-containing protein [Polynucleobacter corsicus]